jgi:Tol biopolymer transport system component
MGFATTSRVRATSALALAIFALTSLTIAFAPEAHGLITTRIYFKQGKNIYAVDPDGSNRQAVAKGNAFPGNPSLLDPAVSPNGNRIVFSAAGHLWVGTIGGGADKITGPASNNLNLTQIRYPTWSPNSRKIVFQAVRTISGNHTARLYRIDANGSNITQLLKFSGHFGNVVSSPDWSSQNEIAYSHLDDLWLINPDGSGKTNITQDQDNYFEPSWNPEGDSIAVVHEGPGGDVFSQPGLWAVDPTNGDVSSISGNSPDTDTKYLSPSWSPNGNQVAFSGFVNGDTVGYTYDVYVGSAKPNGKATDLDQSTPTRTTHVLTPDWAIAPPG